MRFPNGLAITATGLAHAPAFLILRVETSATLALLLIFTTPWMHVLKALRILRAPVLLVVILGMTCRYILLLLETAHEMFESRKSRTVGALDRASAGAWPYRAAGVLLNRSLPIKRRRLPGHAVARISRRGLLCSTISK